MQKTLLALALIMSSVAFADSNHGMMESEFISADQVQKYNDLPQTIILRVHKGWGNGLVEAARLQERFNLEVDLTQTRVEQVLQNQKLRFDVMAANYKTAGIPKVVKTAKKNGLKSLISDRSEDQQADDVEPYIFGLRAHYRDRGYQIRHSFNLGYPYIQYSSYIYTYLPYGPMFQIGDYVYAFYTWTNYYQ